VEHVTLYGPQEGARRMVDLACQRGGEDNITVVVVRVDES
jgi:serine/threonine protein phosphatase PrpC